jgi:bacteriocin-like protein
MNTDNIDPNKNPTEVPPKDAKTELTEDELSKVSGGGLLTQACCGGTHIKDGLITVH